MKTIFCGQCRGLAPYTLNSRNRKRMAYGKSYEYIELFGVCDICHNEVRVPELTDTNEDYFEFIVSQSD